MENNVVDAFKKKKAMAEKAELSKFEKYAAEQKRLAAEEHEADKRKVEEFVASLSFAQRVILTDLIRNEGKYQW